MNLGTQSNNLDHSELALQMAVDSLSSLSWDYLNSAMRLNFSHALKSVPSSKDAQSVLNLLTSISDAFMSHGIKVLLSGSVADGSFVHPVLRSDNNMAEIDIMCIPKGLQISELEQRSMFYDVPSAPGFIWLHVPEPARVKHVVHKSKQSNLTLASLKKVRNPCTDKVEHFLVGKYEVIPDTEPFSPKNRTELFDELTTKSPLFKSVPYLGDLALDIFGPLGLTAFASMGKEKGSASFNATVETRFRPPKLTSDNLKSFLLSYIPKVVDAFIDRQNDSSSEPSEYEEEENEATVIVPYQGEADWWNNPSRHSSSFEADENSIVLPNLSDHGDDGAACKVKDESFHGYVNFGGSFDLVPAIECEGWPFKARGFIGRDRKWPSPRLIRQITQGGFHLVSKCSPKGNKEMEWRISFSVAEITLFENMSAFQRECYQVFKSFYYSELRGPKVLSSYHMKTIFLWACERFPEEYWVGDRLAQIVLGLLDDLLHCLDTKSCPHYFIPENDQFAHASEDILMQHARTVRKIRSQPDRYPSKETQYHLRCGLRIEEGCESAQNECPETVASNKRQKLNTAASQEEIDLD